MGPRAASVIYATNATIQNDDVSWHIYASVHASSHGYVADDGDGLWKSEAGHDDGPRPGAAGTSAIPGTAIHGSSIRAN